MARLAHQSILLRCWRIHVRALCVLGASLAFAQSACAASETFEVAAGASYEHLDHGYADWRSAYVEAVARRSDRTELVGGLRETQRFGLADNEMNAGLYLPLSAVWGASFDGTASGTHRVLPIGALGVALTASPGQGWVASGGVRRTRYNDDATSTATLGLEKYWGDWRFAGTFYRTRLDAGGYASSQRAAVDRYYGDRSHIGVALVVGTELENIPGRGVLSTNVSEAMLAGRHELDRAWSLSWEVVLRSQGSLYARDGVRLGVRRSF